MKLPIGISDFRILIEYQDPQNKSYLFVDKSLLIKDILDESAQVILITRPRRFGKTLNMSMLQHFFSSNVDAQPTKDMFRDLKISQHEAYMKYQGQFPVIFLTFKDVKSSTFSDAYDHFYNIIKQAYAEHETHIKASSNLSERDKNDYELILSGNASTTDIKASLKRLTFYLSRAYDRKPVVLIDEYDTPIQTAYVAKYYDEMVTFMREFLGAGLKDNAHLQKAVLTGILRISKESLFSGLNNIKIYSLLDARYGEYFGFTEAEVNQLLAKSSLHNNEEEMRRWYNGYQMGNTVIYNPWSIINYIQEQGRLRPYWVNTSDNVLIKDFLTQSSLGFQSQFESLLQDIPQEMLINENFNFKSLKTSESTVWTLLLMTGYLKAKIVKETDQGPLCELLIPNNEVKGLYKTFIAEWLSGVNSATVFNTFLNNLLNGNMEDFEGQLRRLMLQTFSVHDVSGKEPEKFFHGFMLGLVSGLDKHDYKIDSNKEGGKGRYDIIVAPNDVNKLGIILEIKSVTSDDPKTLQTAAEAALKQIEDKQYHMSPLLQHVQECLKIGIAFSRKELAVVYQRTEH